MTKIKAIFFLSGYQLTWLMCVFGELIYNSYLPGLIFGIFFLFLSFMYSLGKKKFILILLYISIPGYLFDSVLVYLNIYSFQTSYHIGLLPIWMLVLWPSFAVLFNEVFNFLEKYKLAATIFSGILGPLTYYSGSPLGLLTINNFYLFIILMVFFWLILMVYYLYYLLSLKFN
jgi:hypothetical protein